MKMARVLAMLIAVAILGRSPQAEEFWGRRLENQPTQFIFGYGSLINTKSRDATAAKPSPAIPARIAASFGYIRIWNDHARSGFTALGLKPAEPPEAAMTINGVLYPAENQDMSLFDAREAGYTRLEVLRRHLEPASWQGIPSDGQIWIYVPKQGAAPDAEYPLLQSYIDVVLEGGLEYGTDFAREIVQTTAGWDPNWLNDRRLARRPWVFDALYQQVDDLLAAHAPHFADRALPEAYAARLWRSTLPPNPAPPNSRVAPRPPPP